jgi:hypothetical protein
MALSFLGSLLYRKCSISTEDAHLKSVSTFETDEHLRTDARCTIRFFGEAGSLGDGTPVADCGITIRG